MAPSRYQPSFPILADLSSAQTSGWMDVWPHHRAEGHNAAYKDGSARWFVWRTDRMNYTTVREHTTSQQVAHWWKDFWEGY